MLSVKENEMLTRCGPGTPMGNLFRQYWIPTMKSDELEGPDSPPIRIRVLNENLIGFRTTSGKVGLVADYCPHRGASMWYGRNEEDGLRCIYHGWKFDITGQCTDMTSEPPESVFKDKVKITAYPCIERGGVVWSYMGPRAVPPPLPDIEPNMRPNCQVRVQMNYYNYFQAVENNFDTVHAAILHYGATTPDNDPGDHGVDNVLMTGQRHAKFEVVDSEAGVTYGCSRTTPSGDLYWRTHNFMFPMFDQTPVPPLGESIATRAMVPVDDTHCMEWSFNNTFPGQVITPNGHGDNYRQLYPTLPNGTGWLERFRNPNHQGVRDDFGMDRDIQRAMPPTAAGYSGMQTVGIQDEAMRWSQGEAEDNHIVDRSKEHLGTTDMGIIRLRRRMIEMAVALRDQGTVPPGVDNPEFYRMRSGWITLPAGVDWWRGSYDLRYAFRNEKLETLEAVATAG